MYIYLIPCDATNEMRDWRIFSMLLLFFAFFLLLILYIYDSMLLQLSRIEMKWNGMNREM